jgi:alpha-tubulin suppressor-like RCC1 family protein
MAYGGMEAYRLVVYRLAYRLVAAACGASHTLALSEQGGALAFGGNEFGQTGCGAEGADLAHPRPVKAGPDHRIVR